MKKNIAVIGCGYWGSNLIRNLYELGVLNSVCDDNQILARSKAQEYKVRNLGLSQILEDKNIKGVVVAAPAFLHSELSIKCMKAGKHVFVEKPIALDLTEAREMQSVSVSQKKHLMIGHLLQYHPVFVRLKEIVSDGLLGHITYIRSNRLSLGKIRSEEDVLWSFAPHDISMILSLVDSNPKSILSNSAIINQENISDLSSIYIDFENKTKANINVSWFNPFKEHKLIVHGDKKMAVFDDTQPWESKLSILDYDLTKNLGEISLEKKGSEFISTEEKEPLKEECKHFVDVVNENIKPRTDSQEGIRVLEILQRASESLKKGQKIFF